MQMSFLGLISFFFWAFSYHPVKVPSADEGRDTLMINDQVYLLDSVSEAVFNNIPDPGKSLEADTSIVQIFADRILVKTKTKNLVFRNDTSMSESFAVYSYKNIFNEIRFVQIHCNGWESHCEILIPLETGEKTILWGDLKFSPGMGKVISYNVDMGPAYTPNGFQLFRVQNGTLINVFDAYTENWGPKEIKWESDTTILIKRVRYDNNWNEIYDYRRMVIE